MKDNKYFKYKKKYIDLKNQIGGGILVKFDKDMLTSIVNLGPTQCGANVLNMLGFSKVFVDYILKVSLKYDSVLISTLLTTIKKYNNVIRKYEPHRIIYDPKNFELDEYYTKMSVKDSSYVDIENIFSLIYDTIDPGFATFFLYNWEVNGKYMGHFCVILKSITNIPFIYEPQNCGIIEGRRAILKLFHDVKVQNFYFFKNSLKVERPNKFFIKKSKDLTYWTPKKLPNDQEKYKYISPVTPFPLGLFREYTTDINNIKLSYFTDIDNLVLKFNESRETYDIFNNLSWVPTINITKDEKNSIIQDRLKNIVTDFVTTNWFSTKKTSESIFLLVNNLFSYALTEYCKLNGIEEDKIKFVTKGGIVLFMIKNKILKKLSSFINTTELNNFFEDFFKKSDMDFSIIIDESFSDSVYEKIYKDMNDLSYYILDIIRAIIIKNPDYCDFLNLSSDEQNKKLKDLLHLINTTIIKYKGENINNFNFQCIIHQNIKHTTSTTFEGLVEEKQQDLFIFMRNNKIRTSKPFDDVSNYIMSWNNSIDNTKTDNLIKTKFHLNRVKSLFNLFYKSPLSTLKIYNIKGEIIDISIQHKNTTHLMKLKDIDKNTISNENFNTKIDKKYTFYTGTIDYQIKDLKFMIFNSKKYPWENIKYEKRLYRLLLILFFKELMYDEINYKNNIVTLKYLKFRINKYLGQIEKILEKTTFLKKLKELERFKLTIKSLLPLKKNIFNLIYTEISNINKKLLEEMDKDILKYLQEYHKFIIIIIKTIVVLLDTFNKLLYTFDKLQNKRAPSPLIPERLSSVSLEKKHYKYKNKYLQLKNDLQ